MIWYQPLIGPVDGCWFKQGKKVPVQNVAPSAVPKVGGSMYCKGVQKEHTRNLILELLKERPMNASEMSERIGQHETNLRKRAAELVVSGLIARTYVGFGVRRKMYWGYADAVSQLRVQKEQGTGNARGSKAPGVPCVQDAMEYAGGRNEGDGARPIGSGRVAKHYEESMV